LTTARPLIAGNWKMNGLEDSLDEARAMVAWVDSHSPAARVALFPPATLLSRMAALMAGSTIAVGGQDCRAETSGAFTGDISAEMLGDAGAALVILGHSERRVGYGESDQLVAAKTMAALRAGLEPIICVGESLEERRSGHALEVVMAQIRGSLPRALTDHAFAVAYEPVWAIGSGLTPTPGEIEEVHLAIRATLRDHLGAKDETMPILYGGSVNGGNAGEILATAGVGGALVGGASLTAKAFIGILEAL
jgi:triosephosphate isomerase (TIM)